MLPYFSACGEKIDAVEDSSPFIILRFLVRYSGFAFLDENKFMATDSFVEQTTSRFSRKITMCRTSSAFIHARHQLPMMARSICHKCRLAYVTAHTGTGGEDAPDLISNSLLDDNSITVYLTYPAESGVGTYHLTFVITLDSAAIMEFDYNHCL